MSSVADGARNVVGALGRTRRAVVDEHGVVAPSGTRWELGWWIGADDRWRFPTEEVALRQSLVDAMPVVRTAVRIPSGDALQTVYGLADGSFVVEVTNESPAPFVAALVVSGARSVDLDGPTVWVDGQPAFSTRRPPRRWAATTDATLREVVVGGAAESGPFTAVRDRRRRLEVAFLYPVAHRASLRVRLDGDPDEAGLPGADDVAKGWRTQLERGMRVTLPDEVLQDKVDRARAQAALAAGMTSSAQVLADLLAWGLDEEAALAWERASVSDRARARRSERRRGVASPGDGDVLATVRDLLVRETDETRDGHRIVEIVTELPVSWRGGNFDVRDVPLQEGSLSYTVRWHGEHPALLWEMPDGIELRAPGLDPAWSSTDRRGETLIPLVVTRS